MNLAEVVQIFSPFQPNLIEVHMPLKIYINLMSTLWGVRGNTLPPYKSFGGNKVIHKVTLSSPCLWASCHPYPLFQWYPQTKDILINLSMKCCNSAFNAQGSRLNIVVVQCGAVKIYVATMEALRKKGRQDETQFPTKIDGFLSFIPH